MKKLAFGFATLMSMNVASAHTPQRVPEFDRVGSANWELQDNAWVATTGNGLLVTKESYEDFHLKLEFQVAPGTNSGVFFRCNSATALNDRNCYEANIFDTRPDQRYRTGGVTHHAAPKAVLVTEDGAWHTYEVIARGTSLRIVLDGHETVMMRDGQLASGPIALQFAQGGIKFRNIVVTEIPEEVITTSPVDGVWELASFTLTDGQGQVTPWCEGAYGVIMYTQGYMSTALNCTSNPSKVLLYSGRFEYRDGMTTHFASNFSDPSLNRAFQRSVVMSDEDHLELRGELPGGVVASVKWVRR